MKTTENFVIPAKAGIQNSGSPIKTFGDDTWYQIAVSFLERNNVPDPDISASHLLSHVLKKPRLDLKLNPEIKLTVVEEKQFESLLIKRATRYPLQYLIKSLPFRNAVLEIGEGCLIPRPETELLIDAVFAKLNKTDQLNILDLGTGSGNIAISLAMESPSWSLTATDLSEEALRYAKRNSVINSVDHQINFIKADLFHGINGLFDAIVSNPPYLKSGDLMNAQAELSFEPDTALDGGEDGLSFYRRIIQEAKFVLKKSGHLFLEIGCDQTKSVSELFIQHQFGPIETIKDYAGLERIISACFQNRHCEEAEGRRSNPRSEIASLTSFARNDKEVFNG